MLPDVADFILNNKQKHINLNSSLAEEEHLLQQMSAGSKDAFDMLYKYFQPKIHRYILPFTHNTGIDAQEIIQDIFVKMWMKREAFAGISSLEHYLYRMARNRLIDLKRSKDLQRLHIEEYKSLQPLNVDTTSYEIQYREFREKAVQAIELLPERRRKIFDLSVEKDMSLAEIAATLRLSIDVVKKQLYLATRFVKEYIRENKFVLIPFLLLVRSLLIS